MAQTAFRYFRSSANKLPGGKDDQSREENINQTYVPLVRDGVC